MNENVIRVYVGGQGGFDYAVQKELKQLNQMYPHITCLKALAYMPKNPIPNTTHI